MVRDDVVTRIDGAPCLKKEIVAYPSPDDPFFFNKAEIYKHHTASNPNEDPKVPGIFYFQKITYPETLTCWAAAYAFPEGSM